MTTIKERKRRTKVITENQQRQIEKLASHASNYRMGADSSMTKRERDIYDARNEGFREGRLSAENMFKEKLADKHEIERKQILDTKIKVLDAAGQLMQQMSTLVEGVWHILKETDNAQH